jgi:hypothetical protein
VEADDGLELGPDAPALELPWQDPEGRWKYYVLRGDAGDAGVDVGTGNPNSFEVPCSMNISAITTRTMPRT